MRLTVSGAALTFFMIAALHHPGLGHAQDGDRRLILAGHGRFAVFADLDTLVRDGHMAEIRALQVGEEGFSAGGRAYWGGWSRWRFDCQALTADRLDFASLAEGGQEGPSTPEPSPPYPAAPGGDAHELLTLACADEFPDPDARSIEAAVTLGRARLADPEPD